MKFEPTAEYVEHIFQIFLRVSKAQKYLLVDDLGSLTAAATSTGLRDNVHVV